MRDPFEHVTVRSRKAILVTVAAALLLVAYGMVFPTQVAIVGVVLTLPVIIMLHEAAHFFAAKRAGMKVTEFFIGFGPRIWSVKRGETEYGVKAVVLGGYCRIIGMTNLEEVAPEDEPRAYRSKGYLSRGRRGVRGPGRALPDRLRADVRGVRDLRRRDAPAGVDAPRRDVARRQGCRPPAGRHPRVDRRHADLRVESGRGRRRQARRGRRRTVRRRPQRRVVTRDVTLTQTIYEDGQKAIVAGIKTTVVTPKPGVVRSLVMAPAGVVTVGHEAVDALGKIFSPSGISRYFSVLTGSDKSQEANLARPLSPVGFAQVATHAVSAGWLAVVGLLLSINVFLGLVNLVPLLPFDGGHIAIATYEQIMSTITRRRVRVDVAKLMPIAGAVLVVLLFIAVSSLFLDITHPIGNPY